MGDADPDAFYSATRPAAGTRPDTAAIRAQHRFRTSYGTEMDNLCQFCWTHDTDGAETGHDCEVIGLCDALDAAWQDNQRLAGLATHHAGNRAMADVEIGQLRARLDAVRALCENPASFVAGDRVPVVYVSAIRAALDVSP